MSLPSQAPSLRTGCRRCLTSSRCWCLLCLMKARAGAGHHPWCTQSMATWMGRCQVTRGLCATQQQQNHQHRWSCHCPQGTREVDHTHYFSALNQKGNVIQLRGSQDFVVSFFSQWVQQIRWKLPKQRSVPLHYMQGFEQVLSRRPSPGGPLGCQLGLLPWFLWYLLHNDRTFLQRGDFIGQKFKVNS